MLTLMRSQQRTDLFGIQQARNTQEVLLLLTTHGEVAGGELGTVKQHSVEGRFGAERLEFSACQLLGGAFLAVCLFEQVVVQAFNHGVDFFGCAAVEGVVAFDLHIIGEHHQLRHRGQEHGGGFAALAGTHETANRLGKE